MRPQAFIGIVLAAAAVVGDSGPPIVWMAPFLSGGGYSSEAIAYAIELDKVFPNFATVQFAEQVLLASVRPARFGPDGPYCAAQADPGFSKGLPTDVQQTLQRHPPPTHKAGRAVAWIHGGAG
jgi:hypothetical protein